MADEPPDPVDPSDDAGDDRQHTPPPPSWGTTIVLFASLAVALVMAWSGVSVFSASAGAVVTFGGVDPVRVWQGEVWRLFTACFTHVGAIHLGLNLWVLWQVGRVYERLAGTARFLLVYVVSGIFGFALSTALSPGLTAGASGAIFGVTGALLAIATVAKHKALGRFLMTSLMPFVVATFALGFLLPMINNTAHAGGLIMGFIVGYGTAATDTSLGSMTNDGKVSHEPSSWRELKGNVALVAGLAAFGMVTLYAAEPRWSPRYHSILGLQAVHDASLRPDLSTRIADGKKHLEAAQRLAKNDASTMVLEARLKEVEGDTDGARKLASYAFDAFNKVANGDRTTTFDKLTAELGLLDPDDEMPYQDGFTVRLLCDAALGNDDEGKKIGQAPLLKNSCAWLFVRARETAVRDAARGLALARAAHEEKDGEAAITHTYAIALAENGNVVEAIAVLEKLEVQGKTGELGAAFVKSEKQKLKKLLPADTKADAVP